MNVAINILILLFAASIIVVEINVMKNLVYKNTKEGAFGFAISAFVIGVALLIASFVEW